MSQRCTRSVTDLSQNEAGVFWAERQPAEKAAMTGSILTVH
jgi:hypothetical protein